MPKHTQSDTAVAVAEGLRANGVTVRVIPMHGGLHITPVSGGTSWLTGYAANTYASQDRLVDGEWQPVEEDGSLVVPTLLVDLADADRDTEDVDLLVRAWTAAALHDEYVNR